MPGKRPVKKGSFGSHFDEVVKHFPHEKPETRPDRGKDKASDQDTSVHDKLFERAWRSAKKSQPSGFSNQ
jgi:hypothetical protein